MIEVVTIGMLISIHNHATPVHVDMEPRAMSVVVTLTINTMNLGDSIIESLGAAPL